MATSYGAAAPVLGPSGLVTGYSNSPRRNAGQAPIYDASGLISGYSGGSNSTPVPAYNNPQDPAGYYNFNPVTGLNPQGLNKGQQAAKDYSASTQTVSNTKSAPIAAAASTTLSNENQLQSGVVKSFSDYLAEAKQLQDQGQQQVAQDTATLNAAPAQLQSNLSNVVQQFANTAGALDQKVTGLNTQNAATVDANIAQSQQNIADYQTAAEGVANQAIAAANARSNAYQSGSGTPTSNSGYLNQLAANTTANIMLPVEQQVAGMKQTNLTNYISPQEQNLYANNIAQVTGLELPVAQTLVQYGITNANQVAQLQAQLSGKALNEQVQYLTSLGIPITLATQVAQSLPSAVTQLSNVDLQNTFYGLAQDYQNPVSTGFPAYNPGIPQPSNYGNRNNSGYPNQGNVQSGQQQMGNNGNQTVGIGGVVTGPPVGVNAAGQLVDASGNVVNYAPPASRFPLPGATGTQGYPNSFYSPLQASYDQGYGYTPGGEAINPDVSADYFSGYGS